MKMNVPADLPNILPAMPEIFLALSGMILLMLGVFGENRNVRMVSVFSTITLLVAGFLASIVLYKQGWDPVTTFNGLFVLDGFAVFMKVMIIMGAIVALIMSGQHFEKEECSRFEYPVLVIFATLGMMMMVSANNLMSLYIGLELQSLSLYVLAAFQRDNMRSSEAGLKYFVLGALSSGLLLYGASLIYGFTGSTSFEVIAGTFEAASDTAPSIGVVVGLVFVLAAMAFKISAVPFHMWTPDVYEGAPTPVTALFAIVPKVAAIALLTRVLVGPFADLMDQWQQVIILVSILSMALGGFAGIAQTNIKRLMAYSSIGNMGYALMGLAAAGVAGVQSMIVYMAIYMVMSAGVFAIILCMRRQGRMVEELEDLKGLSKSRPLMALVMAILMFSMTGIPPMAGFFGKLFVFQAAVGAGLYTLAIIGVITSVVAAFYYLRIIHLMYFAEPEDVIDRPAPELKAITVMSGAFVLLFIIFPMPLIDGARAAAESLIGV